MRASFGAQAEDLTVERARATRLSRTIVAPMSNQSIAMATQGHVCLNETLAPGYAKLDAKRRLCADFAARLPRVRLSAPLDELTFDCVCWTFFGR